VDQLNESRKKKLRFGMSKIHMWGVFADEGLVKDDMLLEYRGEIIRQAVADRREVLYAKQGQPDYMFRIDGNTIIDATKMGSLARFVNHSCDPNCYTQIIQHDAQPKIIIYAKRDIRLGEELCYDYKFPIEEVKIPCHCGEARYVLGWGKGRERGRGGRVIV
jgi:histone-lysine N-methyltransferase SETD1